MIMQARWAGTHPFAETQNHALLLRVNPVKTGGGPNQAKNQNQQGYSAP